MANKRFDFPWLSPWEQEEVVIQLLKFGLIKYDNKRSLPLKSGGKTDVYINIRDARNNPNALAFLAELFSVPLRKLSPGRFVEVPDSVSCFAGPLSIKTDMPYLTIRGEAKGGRVSNAKSIGNSNFGEDVVIIDDVITDGASKLAPYQECKPRRLNIKGLIVLVDRQQGWKESFANLGINMGVWAGMTLHDVRKCLISYGIMERCSQEAEARNPLIVALDSKSWDEILPVIDELRPTGCIFKVNDMLFNEGIKNLLPNLSVYGRVMADLKSHDIPNTVKNIAKHLLPNPPWAVTVHGSGSAEMISQAVAILAGTPTKILAITVLTSMTKDCEEVYMRQPMEQVLKIAEIASRAGAHGLVCSPEEVQELRRFYPHMTLVTPGIRSEGVDSGDQKRISTPKGAKDRGSDYLVLGRQIFGAKSPVAEVNRVMKEELGISI